MTVQALAGILKTVFLEVQEYSRLSWCAVRKIFSPPFYYREFAIQMDKLGVGSLFIIILTGTFTGMVMALQTFHGFQRFHAESFVGSVVALSLTRELSPVLTAFMVTGRVGSAIAAELGTMRVTEQIDAMTAPATEPVQYLVVPRVAAAIIMMPPLVVMGDAVGMFGGYVVAVLLLGANPVSYVENSFQYLEVGDDIVHGLIKAAAFGLVFSLIACVRGYHTEGGAEGVGRSTTSAVVAGSLSILLVDFFLTKLLN